MRRMLRTKEAAEYLAVSEWKIRQLFHTGEEPYIQNGQGAVTVDVKISTCTSNAIKRVG